MFRDLAANYGFTFLYRVLADFFLLIKFPGPEESIGFFGYLAFHFPGLPLFVHISCTGLDLDFQFNIFNKQVHY
ncbi:hypothetical protein SDC9_205101 [bioreactor metagenome]|uniref:Uncharacterized protein n=1 Tax=bioreactor metagenome TaxID=1076179 RepID=A0A645J1X6_9ZZZZ